MLLKDVNITLRGLVNRLITQGWVKTQVGRILLGANGQAHLNHWMKNNDDGSVNDFGIRPLQKLAALIGYEVHVVFLPPSKTEKDLEYIENQNNTFVTELESRVNDVLSNNIPTAKITRTSRGQIDNVLDDLINM